MGQSSAMQPPGDPSGYAGMNQGHEGLSQGFEGSVQGQAQGPQIGMQRAAQGGMDPNASPLVAMILRLLSGGMS